MEISVWLREFVFAKERLAENPAGVKFDLNLLWQALTGIAAGRMSV
jgi:hypothetical protein